MTPLQFEEMYEEEWTELEALLGRGRAAESGASLHPPPYRAPVSRRCIAAPASTSRWRARAPIPPYIVDRLERITARRAPADLLTAASSASRGFASSSPLTFRARCGRTRRYVAVGRRRLRAADAAHRSARLLAPGTDSVGRQRGTGGVVRGDVFAGRGLDRTRRARLEPTGSCSATTSATTSASRSSASPAGCLPASAGCSSSPTTARSRGAVAGYLTERGLSSTFYSFVATHSAFELTAIVLSGAAGLRIGHALLAPGRLTRRRRWSCATRESAVLLYGVTALLLVAAAVEAFWSSATWLPPASSTASPPSAGRRCSPTVHFRDAVQVDALAVRLRPRTPMEAADLGVRLCQHAARSIYPCYCVVALPVDRRWRSRRSSSRPGCRPS